MTKSCRQQISEAALAVLANVPAQTIAGGGTAVVTIEANRRVALTEDDMPWLGLYEADENPANDFSSEDGYELSFTVQGAVKGSGPEAVTRANSLRADTIAALFADRTLGIGCRYLELADTGQFIGVSLPSEDTEGFDLAFRVVYATREGDPFTFEP